MSALPYIRHTIIPAALALVEKIAADLNHPAAGKIDHPGARAMLIAIGLQESRFKHRTQIGGPAHGFWQFELGGGVRGVQGLVLRNPNSAALSKAVLERLAYGSATAEKRYDAIVDNDMLGCLFARVLLWTYPGKLPARGEAQYAWEQYIDCWRPGKPHRGTWDAFYLEAWE